MIPPLLQAVKENHGGYQDVARIFHKMGPEVLDTLIEGLRKDDDYRVHSAVTWTLGLHGMPLLPKLRKWLADDSPSVRHSAADALYRLTHESGVKLPDDLHLDLLRALNDSNANVRQEAAGMLARLPGKIGETAPALSKAARTDADITVRMRSAGALGHCCEKLDRGHPILTQTVETLSIAAEKDDSFYVREISIYYLARLAGKDERALRALVRALSDEVESVRNKAADALKELGRDELTKM
jgi:HEAT repeat protein